MFTRIYERVLATGTEEEVRRVYEYMSDAERCIPYYGDDEAYDAEAEWASVLAWIKRNGGKVPEDDNLPF